MDHDPVASWQALSQLYEQADELDAPALAGFLRQLEQRGEPMLPALRRMLRAREQARDSDFLGSLPALLGAADAEPAATSPHAAGALLGPYRLLRVLGRGGMAEVWLAERADGAFQRQVALKLLFRQPELARQQTFAQRFARERDILAALDHAHIAALHDAGVTPDGQAWLALEFVEGRPITDWCDQRRAPLRERVELFGQVLQAVAHAHARLVLHRDLKPANILVDAQGRARLLDFGIAKLIEPDAPDLRDTELTRHGGRPLTPQYASPEQLLGQPLTTASDVYSLGVVLYEMLCGQRPAEPHDASALALERAVVEREARPPSRRVDEAAAALRGGLRALALARALRRDLDAVAGQALALEPARRYATVQALHDDLQRWLRGEPVQARRPTAWYRALRFVQRHRLGSALAAASLAALAGTAGVATVLGLQAREESRRAQAARDFVLDLFQRADPDRSRGAEVTAREMLAAGAAQLSASLHDQPALRAELLGEIAAVQQRMGLYAEAGQLLSQKVEVAAGLGDAAQARARLDAADNALQRGDLARAASLIETAGPQAARHPRDDSLQYALHFASGWLAIRRGDAAAATASLDQAMRLASDSQAASPQRRIDTFTAQAEAARLAGRPDRAVALLDQAVAIAKGYDAMPAADRIALQRAVAIAQYRRGAYAALEAQLGDLLSQCERLLGADSEPAAQLRELSVNNALRLGKAAEVAAQIPALERAMAGNESASRRLLTAIVLTRWHLAAGRLRERDDLVQRLREASSGGGAAVPDGLRHWARLTLAEASLQAGQADEALSALDPLLPTDTGRDAGADEVAARALLFAGLAHRSRARWAPAVEALQRSAAAYERVYGAAHPFPALARLHAATALRRMGRAAEAAALVDAAWPILESSFGSGSPQGRRLGAMRSDALGSSAAPSSEADGPVPFVT